MRARTCISVSHAIAQSNGVTIGPVEMLTTLSSQTEDASRRYERQLKSNNVSAVLDGLDHDLKAEQITSEVYAMFQALK
jgi:hypothetical protein